MNRVFIGGKGSYDLAIKNSKILLSIRPDLIARMTVNPRNVLYLFDGIKGLLDAGFIDIMPVPDEFDKHWDEQSIKYLLEQGKKIIDYIKENSLTEAKIGLIDDMFVSCKNSLCDGGVTSVSINTNGDVYPCMVCVGIQEFKIGDILLGINNESLQHIK